MEYLVYLQACISHELGDTDGVGFVQMLGICLDFMLSQAHCLMTLTTCFCAPYSSHLPLSFYLAFHLPVLLSVFFYIPTQL